MRKVKNTIPVYDIGSLDGSVRTQPDIVVSPFAAYLEVHPNLYASHRHDFYHMVLFTSGGGYHTIDFEQFPVKTGQIYFMVPGQVHSWNFEGEVNGYVINFSETLFKSFLLREDYLEQFPFFRGVATDSVIALPKPAHDEAVHFFERLLGEVESGAVLTKDMVCALLIALFITVQRVCAEGKPGFAPLQSQLLLSHFRKLVDKYFTEKHLPKEYAAILYITPNHLNALCKDLLGKPAGEVIRDRILLEAKRLLVNMSLNSSAISDRLNFSDNSYFTKFFKKYTGVTPEEFRKKSIGKHR